MRRRTPRLAVVRTGRSPHEILVCITALLIGTSGLILPTSISPAIDATFPPPLDNVYFAGLVGSAALTLIGILRYRVEGLLLERIGLGVQAAFFAAYAVAILADRGLTALGFAFIPFCFTVSNVARIIQIRNDLLALPDAIRRSHEPRGDTHGG